MPTPNTPELQADALALAIATRNSDTAGLRAVLTPYMEGIPETAAVPVASLLTMLASLLGESFEVIANNEGVDFDTFVRLAGARGAQHEVTRCSVCGTRVVLDDPQDPESYVHAEDGDWGDHTAQVS